MKQVSIDRVIEALKMRDIDEEAIKDFLHDLYEDEEIESDEEDFNYFDADSMSKLKSSEEGKDILLKAPTMKREELKEAIKKYLGGK